ncbi:MAG: TIGR02757 family protein [Acidimicrobiia bacterium]|nr:TIGR02757 family protein [Acidimicrobiia bacterium]
MPGRRNDVERRRKPGHNLRSGLDTLYDAFNANRSVADPVWIVRRFDRPDDQEVIGFMASALAFGRVQSVLNAIDGMLAVIGPSPAGFVRDFTPARDRDRFKHLVHRWTNGADFAALVWVLHQMIRQSGSIENFFAEGLGDTDVDVSQALQSFSTRALALDVSAIYGRKRPKPGVAYFFSRPSSGGACKRLNLYLRWMVRDDKVDLGVWTKVKPAQLIVPLDTHIIRVGKCLRLTSLKSPGWRMAADITRSLRALDGHDPIKFDFSICHLGMMNGCGFGKKAGDARCPLKGACFPEPARPDLRDSKG